MNFLNQNLLGILDTITGTSAHGDSWYRGASDIARLARPSTRKVPVHPGGAADPAYKSIVQVVVSQLTDNVSGTTTIPSDDTIPTYAEGVFITSVTITPQYTDSIILVFSSMMFSASVGGTTAFALHNDGSGSSESSVFATATSLTAGFIGHCNIVFYESSGSTSARTYAIRAGGLAAQTTYISSFSATEKFGTAKKAALIAVEFAA